MTHFMQWYGVLWYVCVNVMMMVIVWTHDCFWIQILGEKKAIPEWMKDGASQKDKDILCEFVNINTPDGKRELIKNARVQFVYGRRYGLIGQNGSGMHMLCLYFSSHRI